MPPTLSTIDSLYAAVKNCAECFQLRSRSHDERLSPPEHILTGMALSQIGSVISIDVPIPGSVSIWIIPS